MYYSNHWHFVGFTRVSLLVDLCRFNILIFFLISDGQLRDRLFRNGCARVVGCRRGNFQQILFARSNLVLGRRLRVASLCMPCASPRSLLAVPLDECK